MATKKDFVVKNGLQVGKSLTVDSDVNISGTLNVTGSVTGTYAGFDSDFNAALDSAALNGTGLSYNSTTNTLSITDTGVTAGTYGSASLVPVLSVNAQGQIDSAGTVSVAGVSSTAFDSASHTLTINTADGGSFNQIVQTKMPGTAGSYGSAALVPVVTVNEYGLVDSINEVSVAGVSTFDFDSATGQLTIGTADGGSFSQVITLDPFNTGDLIEGSNLYYTTARGDSDTGVYISGDRSYGNITTTGYIRGPSTFYIDPAPVDSDAGLLVIRGDLQVDGTTTTVNSTTVSINDKNIILADSAANASEADGAGITVEGANATITYDAANDEWDFNKDVNVTGTTETSLDLNVGGAVKGNAGTRAISVGEAGSVNGGLQLWGTTTGTHYVQFGDESGTSSNHYRGYMAYSHSTDSLFFGTSSDTRVTIDASGNLLIDTTVYSGSSSPQNSSLAADAGTVIEAGGVIQVGRYQNSPLRLNRMNTAGDIIEFRLDGVTKGTIGVKEPDLWIGSDDVNLKFQDGAYSCVVPANGDGSDSDNDIDLGYPTRRFKDLYLSGKLTNDGTGGINIDIDGRVGIGTGSTVTDIPGTSHDTVVIGEGSSTSRGAFIHSTNNMTFGFYDGVGSLPSARVLWDVNDDQLRFYTRNAAGTSEDTRMVVDTSGNVGIGTTSPERKLHISGSGFNNSSMTIQRTDTGSANDGAIIFKTAAGANNNYALGGIWWNNTVDGNYNALIRARTDNSSGTSGQIEFVTGTAVSNVTASSMTIKSSGNVGIGTPSPSTRLHVYESGMVGSDPVVKVDALYQTDTSYTGHGSIMQLTTDRGDGFTDGYLLDVQNSAGTALKIRGDRITSLRPGTSDYLGNQSGIVGKTLQIHSEYDAAGSQWNAFGYLNGNWLDGSSGVDSHYGLIFGYQNNVRGGLIYDTRSTERMAMWSSYGRMDFMIADAVDGNGVPIDSNINEAMTIAVGGNVGIGTTSPDYLLDMESTSTGLTHNLKLNKSSTTGDYAEIAFQLWSGAGTGLNTFGGSGTSRPSVVLRAINEASNSAAGAFVVGTFTGGADNSTLTEKFRIASGGNVGIGTTSPSYKLQVGNGSGTSPHLFLDGVFGTTNVADHARIYFNDPNFGIGAGGNGTSNDDDLYIWAYNGAGRDIRFAATTDGASAVNSGSWTTNVIIKNDGNVGIGTTSPSSRLHLRNASGNCELRLTAESSYDPSIRMTGENNSTGEGLVIRYDNSVGDTYFENVYSATNAFHFNTASVTNALLIKTDGSIDASVSFRAPIFYDSNDTAYYLDPANTGTSAKFAGQIEVKDGIRIQSSGYSTPYNLFALSDTYDGGTYYGIKYVEGSPDVIQFIGQNNVGLSVGMDTGDTTASHSLRAPIFYDNANTAYYFDGSATGDSIRVAGDIVAYYSDARLKDFHGRINGALDKVLKINGYYYTENEKAKELGYNTGRTQVGVSAQEIEEVLPEVIKDAPIGHGYKTVQYERLVPLLIEAIKEQNDKIERLEAMVEKLINTNKG